MPIATRHLIPALLVLLVPAAALAEPKIDGQPRHKPYTLVRLKAVGVGPKVGIHWRVRPQEPANVGKVQVAGPANKPELVFVAPPGRYLVELISFEQSPDGTPTIGADELLVEVEAPGPGPVPPPDPVPPQPNNPYRAKLQAAFAADAGDPATKDAQRRQLAAVWDAGRRLAMDETIATTADLAARLRATGDTLLGPTALKGTRTAIADLVAAEFPANLALTPDARTRAAVLFRLLSEALLW